MQWSIVMPVYNEEAVIEKVVQSFQEKILTQLNDCEFILVNDASRDRTADILDRLAQKNPRLKIIHMRQNGGHGKALLAGYQAARGESIFHCDSDNQHDPSDFWKLHSRASAGDVVLGVRAVRHDPLVRRIITVINRAVCFLLFGSTLSDHNAPFKIYSRRALDSVLGIIVPLEPFAPSIEMNLVAQALGFKIVEVPVVHLPRLTGTISIVRWKLLKVCFQTFGDLFRLRLALPEKNHGS